MTETIAHGRIDLPRSQWRLVVSDLDGTLLDERGRISDENVTAISELARCGIGFTIATGRMDRMVLAYVRQLDIRLPIISCNGAVIRDCRNEEILFQKNLAEADVWQLVGRFLSRQADFLCYSADAVFYPAYSRRIGVFHQYNLLADESATFPVPLHELDEAGHGLPADQLVKVLAVVPDDAALADTQGFLAGLPGCSGVLSMVDSMDITAAGMTKGLGLQRLSTILGIGLDHIVAFGDNDNDESLLSMAGLGIAMANATPVALAASQMVTGSHSLSGVAEAIKKYILPACRGE